MENEHLPSSLLIGTASLCAVVPGVSSLPPWKPTHCWTTGAQKGLTDPGISKTLMGLHMESALP
jgi:hypothetical protein